MTAEQPLRQRRAPPEMTPGIRPGAVPPFYALDEYTFQDMCRDLLEEQADVATCNVYGVRGETQHGIDLLAQRVGGDGIEVGQCKAHRDFSPADIKMASDEFFAAWDQVWSKQDVRRFILFVGGSLEQVRRQQAIAEQRQRFADHNIAYEAWSGSTLRTRLGPHKAIVARYCVPASYWVQEICGEPFVGTGVAWGVPGQTSPSGTLLLEQIDLLAAGLSGQIRERIEALREQWREGIRDEIRARLDELQGDSPIWNRLTPDVRAGILRFRASVELAEPGRMQQAEVLADEAAVLDPQGDDRTVRALIAFQRGEVSDALARLDGEPTLQVRNLRMAVLLASGQLELADELLGTALHSADANAETYRLAALREVLRKDIVQARLHARKACELAPRWAAVRHTMALVDYYGALAPAAAPDHIGGWPEPVDWLLVRRDDESVARLRAAATIFGELADKETLTKDRQEYEAWHLACLLNDADHQELAIARARALLDGDPSHFRVMAWVTARRLRVDIGAGERTIERRAQLGQVAVEAVATLVAIYLTTGRRAHAAELLARCEDLFHVAGAAEAWEMLSNQAEPAVRGKVDPRQRPANQLARLQQIAALEAAVKKRGGARRLAEALRIAYEDTADVRYLLERHQVLVGLNDWGAAADQIEALLAQIGTADAVRLTASAAYNAHQAPRCVEILDVHRDAFPGSALPLALRRLRAAALRASGMLPEAIAEAQLLVQDEPTTANRLHLVRLYLAAADRLSVVIEARRLLTAEDLAREDAVWLAARVHREDIRLARDLWRRAVASAPPALVPALVDLAFQLGLDHEPETRALMGRLSALGALGQADVRAVSFDELRQQVHEWREHEERINTAYRQGEMPIHLVAAALRLRLSAFYRGVARRNAIEPNPLAHPALLVRHGRRSSPAVERVGLAGRRLLVDITGLLLAAQADILDAVERTFGQLFIAPELVPALVEMYEHAAPHQPAQLDAMRTILRLVDEGACAVLSTPAAGPAVPPFGALGRGRDWEAALEHARSSGGYLVDHLPAMRIEGDGPVDVPDWAANLLLNEGGVIDALRSTGAITKEVAEEARVRVGVSGAREIEGTASPAAGETLYCHGNMAETLAGAGILGVASSTFRVVVDQAEVERCRTAIAETETLIDESRWLSDILERLRRGIEAGTYRVISERDTGAADAEGAGQEDDEDDALSPSSVVVASLRSLLATELGENDALWIDDRYLNRFLRAGAAPIVGITDVLKALREADAIDNAAQFRVLTALRAANFRYLPILRSELEHHLRDAPLDARGAIMETEPLRILRRYVAACALQGDVLQHSSEGLAGDPLEEEGTYLLENGRAAVFALLGVWQDADADDQTRRARAEWVLEAVHVDHHGLMAAAGVGRTDVEDRYRAAASVSSLFAYAISLATDRAAAVRRGYFEWVDERVLQPRVAADPGLLTTIASVLRNVIIGQLDQSPRETVEGRIVHQLWQSLIEDLPSQLREELGKEPTLMARLGVVTLEAAQLRGWSFEVEAYWRAAGEAMNGREATLTELNNDAEIRVSAHVLGGRHTVALTDPASGATHIVGGEELELLSDRVEVREAVLRRVRHWFDCSAAQLNEQVAAIAAQEDPFRRVRAAKAWRDLSAAVFYQSLWRELQATRTLKLDQMRPPSTAGLLRHYRLDESGGAAGAALFHARWTAATERLLEEEGLVEALRRAVSLPVPLPAPLVNAFAAAGADGQRAVIRSLLRTPSPLSWLHLMRLSWLPASSHTSFDRLARRLVRALLSPAGTEMLEAFMNVVKWTHIQFWRWPDARGWSPDTRLAMVWAHAHHLFAALCGTGAPPDWVGSVFGQRRISTEWFEREYRTWYDVAHPTRADGAGLLLAGVAYARGTGTLDDSLQELLRSRLFPRGEPSPYTVDFGLLTDQTRASNSLGSFLGGSRQEQLGGILGSDIAATIASQRLQALLQAALGELESGRHSLVAWAQVYALIGDLPPGPAVREQLGVIIRNTDFAALARADPSSAWVAMHAAAILAGHLTEDVRQHLEEQLVALAAALALLQISRDAAHDDSPVDPLTLLDAALQLSGGASLALVNAVSRFAELAARIAYAWPAAQPRIASIARVLCEDLPVTVNRPMWKLVLDLRARS